MHHGPLVKRLRHGPLKAETGVRFSHGSPRQTPRKRCLFFVVVTREENRSAPSAPREVREFAFTPQSASSSLVSGKA